MKMFPWSDLSDTEFVEKVRKQTQSAKRRAWFLLSLSVIDLGLIFLIWCFAKKLDLFQMGFIGGWFAGFFMGVFLAHAGIYFAFFLQHLFGYRKERLLIAYYEQLNPQKTKP
jgi:hypothetical protein